MIDSKVFLGLPLQFEDICEVYPPTVGDIVANNLGLGGYKLLTQTQEDLEEAVTKNNKSQGRVPSPFEFILINAYMNKDFEAMIQAGFELLTHKKCLFLYEHKLILLGTTEELLNINDLNDLHPITEDNFFDFQNILRKAMGDKEIEPIPPGLDPISLKVLKAGRRRERIAKKGSKGVSLTQSLCAICCMEMGINPLNIREISYAAIAELSKMWQRKEKYHLDVDSILAGADTKKVKPKYWIKEDSELQEVTI